MHFDSYAYKAMVELKDEFPEEWEKYGAHYAEAVGDEALERRKYLINPMNFIGTAEKSNEAQHYRIRVGASDADTAFTVSMALYLKLLAAGKDADYALVWDKPPCHADYPGEVVDWIRKITK